MLADYVNKILLQNKFKLKKGDVSKVITELDKSDPTDVEIIECAKKFNIDCPPKYYQQTLPTNKIDGEEIEKIKNELIECVVTKTIEIIKTSNIINDFVNKIINNVVNGTQSVIRTDITPWDHSTHGVRTNKSYDLSKWEILGDYFKEPSGNTRATYCSGNGLCASLIEDELHDDLIGVVFLILRESLEIIKIEKPNLTNIFNDEELDEIIIEDSYDLICMKDCDESYVYNLISELPFRKTLLKFRPDVKKRLEKDIKKREDDEKEKKEISSNLDKYIKIFKLKFENKSIDEDNTYELINEFLLLEENDPVKTFNILNFFFYYEEDCDDYINRYGLDFLFSNSDEFDIIAAQWNKIVDGAKINFNNILVRLFFNLTNAWKNDGRSFYITINEGQIFSTFSIDNWIFFFLYALTNGYNIGNKNIIVRRFEHDKKLKSVGGLTIQNENENVIFHSAEDTEEASLIDYKTRKRVQKEPSVTYVNMNELCPAFVSYVNILKF